MVSASPWSWVTNTKVMPTSRWIRLSSSCIASRSLRSSAASGSSSSSADRHVHQGPGQGHALLLAAGELARPALGELGQLDDVEHLHAPWCGPRPSGTFFDRRPKATLSTIDHVREQRVLLEHRVDVPLVRRHRRDVVALEQDGARRSGARTRRSSSAASSCRSPTVRAARRTRPSGSRSRRARRRRSRRTPCARPSGRRRRFLGRWSMGRSCSLPPARSCVLRQGNDGFTCRPRPRPTVHAPDTRADSDHDTPQV